MVPVARAAKPPGESVSLVLKGGVGGGGRQGTGQAREGAGFSVPRPLSLALLFLQLGEHFKPGRHFAFKALGGAQAI